MRFSFWSSVVFLSAMAVGAILALISHRYGTLSDQYSKWKKSRELPVSKLYRDRLKKAGLGQTRDDIPGLKLIPEVEYLRSSVKLLCWVVLNGDGLKIDPWGAPNMMSPYKAVSETWSRHCSKTLFFTSVQDPMVDAIKLDSPSIDTWAAAYEIIKYIASKGYLDQYDWFVKADDDTYIIVENLLYYLSVRNATDTHYLGHAFTQWGYTYNVGGSGYVLSKAAFRKLNSALVKGQCRPTASVEDMGMGRCLAGIGIDVEDTRDNFGRGRFLMFHPESLLVMGNLHWTNAYWTKSKYQTPEGPDCCSDYAVSFHNIPPNMMHVLEYLIYHLKPYGISSNLILPANISRKEIKNTDQRYQNLLKTRSQTTIFPRLKLQTRWNNEINAGAENVEHVAADNFKKTHAVQKNRFNGNSLNQAAVVDRLHVKLVQKDSGHTQR